MRKRAMRAALLSCTLVPLLTASVLAQDACDQLWTERNSIYKAGGYCFRTPRGIRAFGNAGCQFDDVADVPLSARARAQVADIQRQERALGCAP